MSSCRSLLIPIRVPPVALGVAFALASACAPTGTAGLVCGGDRDCDIASGFTCDLTSGACVARGSDGGRIPDDAGRRLDAGVVDGGRLLDAADDDDDAALPELDAGEVDAGEVDGGALDAGVDGGAVDGGEVDGGDVDAGDVATDAGLDASLPDDWWNEEWTQRRMLRFHALTMNIPLTSVPVRVPLDRVVPNLAGISEHGDDLRFIDPEGDTELPYEIVSWGPTHEVFVRVPNIERRHDDDFIWLYYGNPGAAPAASVDDVWNDNYVAVHHLEEPPNGALVSSAASGLHPAYSVTSTPVQGVVGRGLSMPAGSQLSVPSLDDGVFPQDAVTVEMWAKGSFSTQADAALFDTSDSSRDHLHLAVATTGSHVQASLQGPNGENMTTQMAVRDDEWRYLVLRLDDVNLGLGLAEGGNFHEAGRPSAFAPSSQKVLFSAGFVGEIDELRISSLARTSDWLRAQDLTMRDLLLIDGPPKLPAAAPMRTSARTPGELVLYDMNQVAGAIALDDTSGIPPPLPLALVAAASSHPSPLELIGGGLRIRAVANVRGADAPTRVQSACTDDSISVEVWVQLDHALHQGPARIFTLAQDTSNATFMVGQDLEGGDRDKPVLVFRLTTDETSRSGNSHNVVNPSESPRVPITAEMLEEPTHLVLTWGGNVLQTYVNGVNVDSRIWTGDCVAEPSHTLAIGTDAFYPRSWTGTVYLAAVYDEQLSLVQIEANHAAGP